MPTYRGQRCFLFTFDVVPLERLEVGPCKLQVGYIQLPTFLECSIRPFLSLTSYFTVSVPRFVLILFCFPGGWAVITNNPLSKTDLLSHINCNSPPLFVLLSPCSPPATTSQSISYQSSEH